MEELFLTITQKPGTSRTVQQHIPLNVLDERLLFLHTTAIEKSTYKNYSTGAHDYIAFCQRYSLAIDPTPFTLARYITFTSQHIASGPKYLSSARHFLVERFPDFDTNCQHPMVQAAIAGSRKCQADAVHRKLLLRLCHLETFLHIARTSGDYIWKLQNNSGELEKAP